jgi:hypothetical protein
MPKLIWMKDTEDEQLKLCKFNEVVCRNDYGSPCFYEFVANIIELINHGASSFIANYIFTDNFWEVLNDDDKICDIFDKGILETVDKLTFEECHKHICNIGLPNFVKIIEEYYKYNNIGQFTLLKLQEMSNIKDIKILLCIYVNKCIIYCEHIEDIPVYSESDSETEYVKEYVKEYVNEYVNEYVKEYVNEYVNEYAEPLTAVHTKQKNVEEDTVIQYKEPITLDTKLMHKKTNKQTLEPTLPKCDNADVERFIDKIKNTTSSQVYYKILLKNNSNNIAQCIYEKIGNTKNVDKDLLVNITNDYILNHLKSPLYEKEYLEKVIYEYGIQRAIEEFIVNSKIYDNIIALIDDDLSKIYLGIVYYIISESFEYMSFIISSL